MSACRRMNFDPYILQKWMTDLNVKTKTIKIFRRRCRRVCDCELGEDFLIMTFKAFYKVKI